MFIRYSTNEIVSVPCIERIQIFEKNIRFKLIGDNEWFRVDQHLKCQFMNHLEASTNNPMNIEQMYYSIQDGVK